MGYPVGARVYVDGRDIARIAQEFPEGSSSFMFPHYKVDFEGGDKNVAISHTRIGVNKREKRKVDPSEVDAAKRRMAARGTSPSQGEDK